MTGTATDLTRPIIGIENRTAQEVFDIMADRIRSALLPAPATAGAGVGVSETARKLLDRLKHFSDAPSDDTSDQRWHFDVLPAMRALEAALRVPAPTGEGVVGSPQWVTYTNWRGETDKRKIRPVRLWFGSTEWHPEPQWLITAVDLGKGVERDFALSGFTSDAASALARAGDGWRDE